MAAEDLINAGALLIDLREKEECSASHAPDALLIPMSQVEARVDEIRTGRPAVVVCRSGRRSYIITQLLTPLGINAVNLAGGTRAWAEAGLPVVTDTGDPGHIV